METNRGNKPSQLICLFQHGHQSVFNSLQSFCGLDCFFSPHSCSSPLCFFSWCFLAHPIFLCRLYLSSCSITLPSPCLLISIVMFSPALLSFPFFSSSLSLVPHFPPHLVLHHDRSMSPCPSPTLHPHPPPPIISFEQVLINNIHRLMNNSPKRELGRRDRDGGREGRVMNKETVAKERNKVRACRRRQRGTRNDSEEWGVFEGII